MGPKAVCMPARKKLSQLKANRLCRDGAAVSSTDSGATTLTGGPRVVARERASRASSPRTSDCNRSLEWMAACQFTLPCFRAMFHDVELNSYLGPGTASRVSQFHRALEARA